MTAMPEPRLEYSDPVKAAGEVLWERGRGYRVPDYILRDVVDAVFACSDGALDVKEEVTRDMWAEESVRQHVRNHLRLQLLDAITRNGHVPTALPTEEIGYATIGFGAGHYTPVPPKAVEHGADYDVVVVRLWVPYRSPHSGRAADVQAGLS